MNPVAKALPPGSVVRLEGDDGVKHGVWHFNPHSLIAARKLDRNPDAACDAAWFRIAALKGNGIAIGAGVLAGELDRESFAGIAKAMGAEGIVVDRLEDVGPALQKAIDMQMNERKTCVIEIMCTRELGDPFRRDALSKPVRYLDKYKDYV